MPEDRQKTSRRAFLEKLASLGTAGLVTPAVLAACGGGAEQTDGAETAETFSCTDTSGLSEQQIQMRDNANYVDDSPEEGKTCDNCQLYVQPEAGAQCGGCQVLAGPIHPKGYCDLWVAAQA